MAWQKLLTTCLTQLWDIRKDVSEWRKKFQTIFHETFLVMSQGMKDGKLYDEWKGCVRIQLCSTFYIVFVIWVERGKMLVVGRVGYNMKLTAVLRRSIGNCQLSHHWGGKEFAGRIMTSTKIIPIHLPSNEFSKHNDKPKSRFSGLSQHFSHSVSIGMLVEVVCSTSGGLDAFSHLAHCVLWNL